MKLLGIIFFLLSTSFSYSERKIHLNQSPRYNTGKSTLELNSIDAQVPRIKSRRYTEERVPDLEMKNFDFRFTPTIEMPSFDLDLQRGQIFKKPDMKDLLMEFNQKEFPEVNLDINAMPMPSIELDRIQRTKIPYFEMHDFETTIPDVELPKNNRIQIPDDIRVETPENMIPNIEVPNFGVVIPELDFEKDFLVDIPDVSLPDMNFDMPSVNLPDDRLDIPDMRVPQIRDLDLPDLDVRFAAQNIPDFNLNITKDIIPDISVLAVQKMVPMKKVKIEREILVPDDSIEVRHLPMVRQSPFPKSILEFSERIHRINLDGTKLKKLKSNNLKLIGNSLNEIN